MRLRRFRAGAVRTTNQGFFSSEFIEGDVIASLKGHPAAANRSQLGRRGCLFRNLAN
jgi:hypothetical protein